MIGNWKLLAQYARCSKFGFWQNEIITGYIAKTNSLGESINYLQRPPQGNRSKIIVWELPNINPDSKVTTRRIMPLNQLKLSLPATVSIMINHCYHTPLSILNHYQPMQNFYQFWLTIINHGQSRINPILHY